MTKYIEFKSFEYDADQMVEIIDEDSEYLYFYNDQDEEQQIEKRLENIDFEFIEKRRKTTPIYGGE